MTSCYKQKQLLQLSLLLPPLLLLVVVVVPCGSAARDSSADTATLVPSDDIVWYSSDMVVADTPSAFRGGASGGDGWQGQSQCGGQPCVYGECVTGRCLCQAGWRGPTCQLCGGRVRLTEPTGVITHGVGNYSTNMQCSWLIDAPLANTSVQLFVEHFATECGWDHVYVFDGDNIYSDLLAVYSGIVRTDRYSVHQYPALVARSGSAYLHFFSDAAYNMTGFRIMYKYSACPSVSSDAADCSGHGLCDPVSGQCQCQSGWTGVACHVTECPGACSGHGRCDRQRHRCVCDAGFKGVDCSQRESMGYWEQLPRSQYVPPGRASHASVVKGDSIWLLGGVSFVETYFVVKYDINGGVWEPYHTRGNSRPRQRYGHTAVLRGDNVYMFGGVEQTVGIGGGGGDGGDSSTGDIVAAPIDGPGWGPSIGSPTGGDGGNDDGGGVVGSRVTDQLWALDTSTRHWEPVHVKADRCYRNVCGPLAVAGHSAVVTSHDRMLVLFGHSPVYGYLNYVQVYHFGTGMWSVEGPGSGALVKGGYGHSSVWDERTRRVYVYGGHLSSTIASYSLSALLHALDPDTMIWTQLTGSESARYLHTASLIPPQSAASGGGVGAARDGGGGGGGGVMLVFGGNTHNDTLYSGGARCYSSQLLAYDIACDRWYQLPAGTAAAAAAAAPRYGHTAAVFDGRVYAAGGYSGRMITDLARYTPGECAAFAASRRHCLVEAVARAGVKCAWRPVTGRCEPLSDATTGQTHEFCDNESVDANDSSSLLADTPTLSVDNSSSPAAASSSVSTAHQRQRPRPSRQQLCSSITACPTCLHSAHNCVWCGANCSHRQCSDGSEPVTDSAQCQPNYSSSCNLLHNCHACHTEPYCKWEHDHKCYTYIEKRDNRTAMVVKIAQEPCGPSCSERLTCSNCTAANCMWCINQMRCVENNAYVVSFPYGQCMEWTTLERECEAQPTGGSSCSGHQTCARCQQHAGCGWCDAGSGTGLGRCLPGGYRSPIGSHTCPAHLWNFLTCPLCQCNGHSTCYAGNSTCRSCGDLTTGATCDTCQLGYFGDPVNGGQCHLCSCNNHGTDCHPHSGKCYCDTKGMVGDRCERCDTLNKFSGQPSTGQQCFYELALDFQFTFNLTKPEDMHYRQINFLNQPKRSDLNTDFHITCSVPAKLNITYKSVLDTIEQPVLTEFNCTQHEHTFSQAEFSFGPPANTTFYVYVYQLQPPLFVQVAFSQNSRLNLRQFFITFSTCFLALLVIAAVLWKAKQRIDNYRRRQRLFVELEQMASRPYARALIEFDSSRYGEQPPAVPSLPIYVASLNYTSRSVPCGVALEQCAGNRAALLTVFIECPTGGARFTPPGLSGLMTGTALVADCTSRKGSNCFETHVTPAGVKLSDKRQRSSVSTAAGDMTV